MKACARRCRGGRVPLISLRVTTSPRVTSEATLNTTTLHPRRLPLKGDPAARAVRPGPARRSPRPRPLGGRDRIAAPARRGHLGVQRIPAGHRRARPRLPAGGAHQRCGDRMRVRLSNAFGDRPLTFDSVYAGLQREGAALVPGSNRRLTFDGRTSVTIPPGGLVLSDPLPGRVRAVAPTWWSACTAPTRRAPPPDTGWPCRPRTSRRATTPPTSPPPPGRGPSRPGSTWTPSPSAPRPDRRGGGARRLHHRRLGVHHGSQPPVARLSGPPPPALPRHDRPGRRQRQASPPTRCSPTAPRRAP